MLRVLVTSLTILFTANVLAQVVSPVEQSYGPYRRPIEGYAPAMAVARDRVLLAWSEIVAPRDLPQIRIGLLDFHGRLVSPITTIPTGSAATSPAVTTGGTSFQVKYLEGRDLFVFDVDAGGTPTSAPRPIANDGTPVVRWQAPHTFCSGFSCGWYTYWTLHWSFAGKSGMYIDREVQDVGPAAAGGSASHFALAWNVSDGVRFLEFRNGTQPAEATRIPASVFAWEQPGVDCDDTHCLIAFATRSRQIYGVLIDSAQPHIQVPVPIETATRVERPQVHLLQKGRFLVSYVSAAEDPVHRFAGRIVTTTPLPRRRAIR